MASRVSLEGGRGDANGLSTALHTKRVKSSVTSWSPAQVGDKEQIFSRSSRRLDCLLISGCSMPQLSEMLSILV